MSANVTIQQQNNISFVLDIRIDTRINLLWFDKREIARALKEGGKGVQKEARRLISRRAVSKAGEFPGFDTGVMSRSIRIRAGSAGMYVKIAPHRSKAMGDDYYPAYLFYGTHRGLEPRADYMVEALSRKQHTIRRNINRALLRALRTRPG